MKQLLLRLLVALSVLVMQAPAALAAPDFYRLRPGDTLAITSTTQTSMFTELAPLTQSGREYLIRPDGRVSLPLIGEISVGGLAIQQVSTLLQESYRPFLGKAHFVVNLMRTRPKYVSVLGEVAQPGTFAYEELPSLLEALSRAGGLREWAAAEQVTILRRGQVVRAIDVRRIQAGLERDVRLEEQDVVNVSASWYKPYLTTVPLFSTVVVGLSSLAVILSRR